MNLTRYNRAMARLPNSTGEKFERLVEIMDTLRGPNGCPRDKRSLLEGIPSKLPAIHEAHQISSRAARVGFDWPDVDGIFGKLQEEVAELKEVISSGDDAGRRDRLEDEIGDMLFVIVNIA